MLLGDVHKPIKEKLDGVQKNIETIDTHISKLEKFVNEYSNQKWTHMETIKALEYLSTVSLAADIVSVCVYVSMILSLTIVSIYYPDSARSLLISSFAIVNLCVWILIERFRLQKLLSLDTSRHCQRARCFTFPLMMLISSFAALDRIDLILSIGFYVTSGLLIIFDIAINIKPFKSVINFHKRIATMKNNYKHRKYSDKQSDDDEQIKHDDNYQHIRIKLN